MSRILTWKVLGIAVGVVFVVAALEGVFGAVVVGITRGMPFTKRV